jgi:hypothetical protein
VRTPGERRRAAPREVLEAGLKEVSSLVGEIEDWCREKGG